MNNSIFSNLDESNVFQENDVDHNYDFDKLLDNLLDTNFITTNNNNYTDLYDNTSNNNYNNLYETNNINNNFNNNINTIKPNEILLQNKPSISFIFVVYTTDVKQGDILENFHDDIFIKQKDINKLKKKPVYSNKISDELYQATEDLNFNDFSIDFKTKLRLSICETKYLN